MSNKQVPNLPAVASVGGADLVSGVQSGVSVKFSMLQIGNYVTSIIGTGVTGLSFGTTGLLPNTLSGGPITVTGTLVAANGGTGYASYTVGDMLYADTTTTLAKLAIGAVNLPLVSNGTAPTYAMLTVPGGGTGAATFTANGVLYGNAAGALQVTAAGTTGQILVGNTGLAPSWSTHSSIAVTSLSFGTTGLTPNSSTTGAIVVAGTLVAANGGTGFASYAVGDILYADTTATLAKLADVATGNVLLSGGIGVAPAWGKVNLTTAVTGTLPVGSGGSGAATFTLNGLLVGNTTSAFQATAAGTTGQLLVGSTGAVPIWITAGTTGQVLVGATGASPAWAALTSTAVTSISFGTTGLTPNSATQGAVTVAGTLSAANGGTGVANAAGSTITLGGALTFSGAFTSAFTVTANTAVTLPTTGTLATLAGSETLTNKTITTFGGALTFNPANANFTLSPTGTGTGAIAPATAGTINNMVIGGTTPLAGTFTTVSDSVGNVRNIPKSGSDKTSNYVLVTTDIGQFIGIGTGGSIEIPDATFAVGNAITIFNNTTGTRTITCTITTAYIAGTDTDKATMTLASRGLATILFLSGTVCVVSGNVT